MKDKQECECPKCHRIFIFESKFFDFYDFDGKCPKCYADDNNISNSPNGSNYETQDEYFGRK